MSLFLFVIISSTLFFIFLLFCCIDSILTFKSFSSLPTISHSDYQMILNYTVLFCLDLLFFSPSLLNSSFPILFYSFPVLFFPPFLFFHFFPQIHKPIIFSTSPHSKYTHWKQTVFYITDPLTVCVGEEIHGKIKCNPNINNPRDLDIEISHKFGGKSMASEGGQMYRLR